MSVRDLVLWTRRFLWFEALAGTAVARLVAGEELVVMRKGS